MKQPMIDVAYEVLKETNGDLVFIDLFNAVCERNDLTESQKEDRIAQFYTDLSLDGRFVCMDNNSWDIKSRHRYEEVRKANLSDILIDDEMMMEE